MPADGAFGYLLVRCLLDLVLVRRPAAPNLDPGGLRGWPCPGVSLIAVAAKKSVEGADAALPGGAQNPPVAERVTREANSGSIASRGPHPRVRATSPSCRLVVVGCDTSTTPTPHGGGDLLPAVPYTYRCCRMHDWGQ